MKKIVLALFVLLVAYLLFWPTDLDTQKWDAQPIPTLTGDFELNERLADTEVRFKSDCFRCEDIAIDSFGNIYGGTEDGRVLKFNAEGDLVKTIETNGRPLGMHLDASGKLIVADAAKGLLALDFEDGSTELLSLAYNDTTYLFTDDLDIAADGKIYFSDASWKFPFTRYKEDMIEHGRNGRLLLYDPQTGQTDLLLGQMYFANGVALSEQDSFVLVNETSAHQIRRYWLKGDRAGTHDIFIDNLPFYPDGVSYNEDGIFWVAMVSPRIEILEQLSNQPFLRTIVARLPQKLLPKPKDHSFILGLDQNGKIVYNLQDADGEFAQITSVQQFDETLYLGSLHERGVGIFDLANLKD